MADKTTKFSKEDVENVKEFSNAFKNVNKEVDDLFSGLNSIGDEIKGQVQGYQLANKAVNNLTGVFGKLKDIQENIKTTNSKDLKSLQEKALSEKKNLIESQRLLQVKATTFGLTEKEVATLANVNGLLEDEEGLYQNIEDTLNQIVQNEQIVENTMGNLGTLTEGFSSGLKKAGLGALDTRLGLGDALQKTKDMVLAGEGNVSNLEATKHLAKELGTNLVKSVDAASLIAGGIKEMVAALQAGDAATGELAKGFNMSYNEASALRKELSVVAATSNDVNVSTKGLQESMVAVGKTLGSNAKLNDADLITFTKLREQAGYTNEELSSIQTLSLANGKTLEDNTAEILGSAQAYASQNKLIVNEKDILKEVGKASASLKLSLGGSAEAVAIAVVKAKQFGLTLEQAEKISSSLLQFESSIESELSAELLTGKELNFEKARQLALEGKTAEAAAEVARQVGSSKDFTKMNVIQQEALAKAAGMERDELAQSLIDKEAFAKIGVKDGEEAKKKYNTLRQTMSAEEAMKALGDETLAKQYEQQTVQERFAQATEKLKEVFIQIAEPVLAIVSPLMDLVGSVLPLINVLLQPIVYTFQMISSAVLAISDLISNSIPGLITFGTVLAGILITQTALAYKAKEGMLYKVAEYAIEKKNLVMQNLKIAKEFILGGIKKGNLIKTIAEAAMTAFKSVASIPIVGPLLGAAAAGAAVALGYSYLTGDDVMSPGESSNGYGKRTLFGPEGAIQLNDKDTVIAGTDLFKKGDDVMSAPKDTLKVSNSTSPPPKPPDTNTQLLDEMKKQNYLREQSNRQNKTVSTLRIQ